MTATRTARTRTALRAGAATLAAAALALGAGAAAAGAAPAPPGGIPDVTLPDGAVPAPPAQGPGPAAPGATVQVPASGARQVLLGRDGHLRLTASCSPSTTSFSVTLRLGSRTQSLGTRRAVCRAGSARLDIALGAAVRGQVERALVGRVDVVANGSGRARTRVALLARDPLSRSGARRSNAYGYWGSAQCLGPGAFGGSATIELTAPPATLPAGFTTGAIYVRSRVVTYSAVTGQWYWTNPTAWRGQALTGIPAWFNSETYSLPSNYKDFALGMIEVYTQLDGRWYYDWNWARLAVATDGAYSAFPYCYVP